MPPSKARSNPSGASRTASAPTSRATQALEVALDFIRFTGIDCFAPAIGNAHGMYHAEPHLDAERVSAIVAEALPIALHGGSGLTPAQFTDLIARGCAKVNISTALKIRYIRHDWIAAHPGNYDPPTLCRARGPRSWRWPTTTSACSAVRARGGEALTTLIFDCDGVLADTERYGHLPAFNQTFREFGLPVQWSEEEYGRRLRIGGGKERMASLLTPEFIAAAGLPTDADGQPASWPDGTPARPPSTPRWWRRGAAARPGIARIIGEALAAGWMLAVASTSAEPSVRAILDVAAGPDAPPGSSVLAGDVVAHKKPAPDIYLLALERLGVSPADVVVIEDSRNGLLAAAGAGLRCLVTVNDYTADEAFPEAVLVVDSLGDPAGEPTHILANRSAAKPGEWLTLADLAACLT